MVHYLIQVLQYVTIVAAEMYDQLHQFVSKVGWMLIFDLNVLVRSNGSWDPTNAIQLMDYTVKKGYKMAGWELGNGN